MEDVRRPVGNALNTFIRYPSVRVAPAIAVGIAAGPWLPGVFRATAAAEIAHVSLVVAIVSTPGAAAGARRGCRRLRGRWRTTDLSRRTVPEPAGHPGRSGRGGTGGDGPARRRRDGGSRVVGHRPGGRVSPNTPPCARRRVMPSRRNPEIGTEGPVPFPGPDRGVGRVHAAAEREPSAAAKRSVSASADIGRAMW